VCPYYLDGDRVGRAGDLRHRSAEPVIPKFIGYCAVLKVREEAQPPLGRTVDPVGSTV